MQKMRQALRSYEVLATLSGVISAIATVIDVYVLHRVLTSSEPIVGPLAYTVIGFLSSIPIIALNSLCFGKRIDSTFPGIHVLKQEMKWPALAGAITALGTVFSFVALRQVDSSVAVALSAVWLLYLIGYERWFKTSSLKGLAWPVTLVILGITLASQERIGFSVSVGALLFIIFGGQGSQAFSLIARNRSPESVDSINFTFNRLIWATGTATLCVTVVAGVTNQMTTLLAVIEHAFPMLAWWLLVRMTLLFISDVTLSLACKAEKSITKVGMYSSSKTLLGVPLALLVSWINPQAFGRLSTNPWIWVLRTVGSVAIFAGIVALTRQREQKAEAPAQPTLPATDISMDTPIPA